MVLLRLVAHSKRAENRIREHGSLFELVDQDQEQVLVRCVTDQCACLRSVADRWIGWFQLEREVNIEERIDL